MRRHRLALIACLLNLSSVFAGQTTTPKEPVAATVCDIMHNPAAFVGRIVKLRATVVGGLESSTIVDANDKPCGGPWFQCALKEGQPPRDSRIELSLCNSRDQYSDIAILRQQSGKEPSLKSCGPRRVHDVSVLDQTGRT
jgi:hypothetical protein